MEELTMARQENAQAVQSGPAAPTVLLIEDDPWISRLVGGLLDDAGYRSVTIVDHAQIGAAVDKFQPGCVLIDGEVLATGQGRSWGDAIALRRTHPELPVLMFTADTAALAEARAGTSDRSRAAGFAGVIGKPFAAEEFLATVRSAIDDSRPAAAVSRADDRADAISFPHAGWRPADDATPTALLSVVVHELRTPLTVISGQIQLARRSILRDPKRQGAALDRALAQVARMDRLITELLELRIGAAALTLDLAEFDLCAIVADVVAQHESGENAQIAFEPTMPDVRVRGDPLRVAQIVGDLVNNALKYGPAGSRIDVSIGVIGAEALVLVEDHGVGVPADEHDRLFEPYYRSTRTRDVSGTGLGLHISRSLAERQGGRLWLERSTEAGSVFALALPISDRSGMVDA